MLTILNDKVHRKTIQQVNIIYILYLRNLISEGILDMENFDKISLLWKTSKDKLFITPSATETAIVNRIL